MAEAKKKPKKKSPTARALEQLRKDGYPAGIVEKWNQWAKVRQDLFGFIDIIYLTPSNAVALQVTVGDRHADHKKKILAEPRALTWLKTGNIIELWSYALQGAKGKVKKYVCRKEELVLSDFVEAKHAEEA